MTENAGAPFGLPIGEAAQRMLRARGLEATVTLASVLAAWEDVVGSQVAAHAQPRRLHASTLTVEVDDPSWATQLQFLSAGILSRLSERLPGSSPTSLSLRVARRGQGRPTEGP
ncbi:MAG TPA: DUF721 domain-containing protein [Acidimicrobiales bacterium]|nr:DUF721 domain-containing protein [Acidimicrobiales bacterium]